ncbi:RNA 2',3'-cyclic phosphodiesterase [Antribacter gilvus]|uniref:RNA 2',3'-cyclic phosphodiesterase n=1 Tax=Antribacter gilvus TaxID=2304675 RepID=UPI000F766A90|nr:RNA 2',3'-cyclic phosphodiesterase [Antribacter gilvus]
MRLFTAVFPPAHVLDHLDLALHGVGANLTVSDANRGGPRWLPREMQHVTLAFYADVPEGSVPDLTDELATLAKEHRPFELRLRGAGTFSSKVLWIGVDGETSALRDLASACLDASPREIPDELKPHRPHLTVARARAGQVKPPRGRWRRAQEGPRSELEPAAGALSVYAGPSWRAESFALVESRMGEGPQGGPLYTPVEWFPLGD